MLKRGLYKSLGGANADIVWVLYELDDKVTFTSRRTGKTETMSVALFEVFYTYHSEFK